MQQSELPLKPDSVATLRACVEAVRADLESPWDLARLARAAGVSAVQLRRRFTRALGVTPARFLRALRLERFRQALRGGESVTDALHAAGFGSTSRLYEGLDARLGMTPTAYRNGGFQERVGWVTLQWDRGVALVAGTAKGLCSVKLGDEPEPLLEELRRELPEADLVPGGLSAAWVDTVRNLLEGEPVALTAATRLPVDVRATAFQARVWEALRRIPLGETRTYAEVAESIGRPTAVRAVAGAVAGNPVAVVIPCHRVVRTDGGLGGYRWGVARKRALLELEREAPEHDG